MANIKVTLEYDGTNYHGWQRQKNTKMTVQQQLEDVLTVLNKAKVTVHGAGRTDAGVHACGQVANFDLGVFIPAKKIPLALNSELPKDIICKQAREVPKSFHARYDARDKVYCYRISNQRFPGVFTRYYVYNIYQPLDFEKMKKAIAVIKGKHDFAAFQARGADCQDTVRTIKNINFYRVGREYHLKITGDGFLYNMVRIIAGTLIEIGLEKRPPDFREIIKSKNRNQAGFTAPAKGLTLLKISY